MNLFGYILFFNPDFMESYITVLFEKVYVPENWTSYLEISNFSVLAHEGVHMYDSKKNPLMNFLYLTPQVVLPILALGLAFVSPWFLLVALLGALPLPSPFRFYYELRGFRMNLLICLLSGVKRNSPEWKRQVDSCTNQMVGSWYYFAMPFRSFVRKQFEKEGWEKEEIYQKTIKFVSLNGLPGQSFHR